MRFEEGVCDHARLSETGNGLTIAEDTAHGPRPDAWRATCGRDPDCAVYATTPVNGTERCSSGAHVANTCACDAPEPYCPRCAERHATDACPVLAAEYDAEVARRRADACPECWRSPSGR